MEPFDVSYFELVCKKKMFTDLEGLGGGGGCERLWEIIWR